MKRGLLIAGTASAVTLALLFSIRASTDALAVVLGVVLGVVASVPTTFLVTYMLVRPASNQMPSPQQFPAHPPVVVINASDKPATPSPPSLPAPGFSNPSRKWTVIGDTDTEPGA